MEARFPLAAGLEDFAFKEGEGLLVIALAEGSPSSGAWKEPSFSGNRGCQQEAAKA